MMAELQFDIENALPRLTDATLSILPHNIPLLVEPGANEHEDVVADPAPAPDPTVSQTGVGERLEEVPDTHQLPAPNNVAALALVLNNFQEAERRIYGVATQEFVYNRRQAIIPELKAEDYMDSETDEEYLQDDEDDEENETDSSMEDPGFPPPANDASRESSPYLQFQEIEHEVHGERRSERPCSTSLGFVIDVLEAVEEIQYCDSGLPEAAEHVNAEESVRAEHSRSSSVKALSMGDPNVPTPMIEEVHVNELIMYVNPSCSVNVVRTLAASPTPTPLLPGTIDTIVICKSSLELATSGANGIISDGVPVQKPAANYASVSKG